MERERLEQEGLPEEEKFHEPSQPLELSADISPRGGGGGGKASGTKTRKTKKKARRKRSDVGEPIRVQPFARALNVETEAESAQVPGPPVQVGAAAEAVND